MIWFFIGYIATLFIVVCWRAQVERWHERELAYSERTTEIVQGYLDSVQLKCKALKADAERCKETISGLTHEVRIGRGRKYTEDDICVLLKEIKDLQAKWVTTQFVEPPESMFHPRDDWNEGHGPALWVAVCPTDGIEGVYFGSPLDTEWEREVDGWRYLYWVDVNGTDLAEIIDAIRKGAL